MARWRPSTPLAVVTTVILLSCILLYACETLSHSPARSSWLYDWGIRGANPRQSFKSFHLQPPVVDFSQWDKQCDDGHILISPQGTLVWRPAPIMLDGRGELVWMDDRFGQVINLQVQRYRGEQYLTFWAGEFDKGFGRGSYYMLDSSYHVFRQFSATSGRRGDFHEFKITANGTALITAYSAAPADLTLFGIRGAGWIYESVFQELDLETGELLFEWRASEHYAIDSTFNSPGSTGRTPDNPFDFFHINSIDKDDAGNYYVSSRFMHSITCMSPSGDIKWILGGKRNNFQHFSSTSEAQDWTTSWQHHMRLLPNSTLSIFDNAEHEKFTGGASVSRAMLIHLDTNAMTADLLQTFTNPDFRGAPSQGSAQIDPKTGQAFVGWGFHGAYTQFAADGSVLCHAHTAPSVTFDLGWAHSYRTLKTRHWVGKPADPPRVFMAQGGKKLYVSWNGATEVERWMLQVARKKSNSGPGSLSFTNSTVTRKTGFEMRVDVPDGEIDYLRVAALDRKGHALGFTETVDPRQGSRPDPPSPAKKLQRVVAAVPWVLLVAFCATAGLWCIRDRLRQLLWAVRRLGDAPIALKQLQ